MLDAPFTCSILIYVHDAKDYRWYVTWAQHYLIHGLLLGASAMAPAAC